jgi:transposase
MSREQRQQLKAVVMDMWDPYIVAVQTKVPHVKIVFDLFHVVSQFNRIIDKVRNSEYRKASKANKDDLLPQLIRNEAGSRGENEPDLLSNPEKC